MAFYSHFVRPVWPAFAVLLVAGFLGSVIEVSLLAFVGSLVDMMKNAQSPEHFFTEHGTILLLMAFIALIARPVVSTVHELIKNQMIAGPVTSRIRWLTHRYVLRQSLGFYQNDFAGRIANKVMQAAPALRESVVQVVDAVWYAAVQLVGAAIIFAAADWRLVIPLLVWVAAYIAALFVFVPRIKQRSTEAAEARSMLVGRIVDSYTNILTVKLFAHTAREDVYARAALEEQMSKWQRSLRLVTTMDLVLYSLNGILMVSASALAIWLWSINAVSVGAIAVVTGLVLRIIGMSGWILWVVAGIFENVGLVQESMETISRAEPGARQAGEQAAGRDAGRHPLRERRLPLRPARRRGHRASGRRDPRLLAAHRAGREGRAGRPVRRGQVDARQPAAALLRPGVGPHPDRRPGHRGGDAGQPAGADRHGDAGHIPAAPVGARQHPLRPPGCERAGDDRLPRRRRRPTTSSPGSRTCAAARATAPTSASAA